MPMIPFFREAVTQYVFLFLDISPEHIDFNIHPAKREVKFRNLPALHHTVTTAMKDELSGFSSKNSVSTVNTAFTNRELFTDLMNQR